MDFVYPDYCFVADYFLSKERVRRNQSNQNSKKTEKNKYE